MKLLAKEELQEIIQKDYPSVEVLKIITSFNANQVYQCVTYDDCVMCDPVHLTIIYVSETENGTLKADF